MKPFAKNSRVTQPNYGPGTVTSSDDRYTVIEFDEHGRRVFLTEPRMVSMSSGRSTRRSITSPSTSSAAFSAFGRPDLGRRVELAYDGGGRLHASWWDWIMVLQGDVAFDAPAVLHAEMEEGDWSNPEEVHRPTAFVSPDDLPTEILLGTDVLRSPIIVWRDHTAAEASLARGHVSGLVVLGLAPGATLSGPVAVHGTTPPGTTVQVRIDNGPWATAEGSPDWRVQVDGAAVPVGEHTLEVRVCTSEGYCSAPESIPFRTASLLFLLVLLAIGVAVVVGLVALARRTLRATRSTRRHKT